MIEQLKTIREALKIEGFICTHGSDAPVHITEALTALSELESSLAQYEAGDMASAAAQGLRDGVASVAQPQEPVAYYYQKHNCFGQLVWNVGFVAPRDATYCYPLYTAAPVAQQYEAGDMASAAAQGFRDGVASVTQQEPQRCDDCGDTVPKRKCYCRAGCVHEATPPAQQPQAEPFGYVSQHTNGTWEFSPTPAGVYPDTAKSITAVYAKQPQAEAVQYTRADLDRAYSAGLVEGERLAIQQAEAVPSTHVLVPVEPTAGMCKAAADAWLDCGSRLVLNKAGAAVRAAIAQQKGSV